MNLFIRFVSRRFTSSLVDLGAQMKKLNDHHHYQDSLKLFENHTKGNERILTTLAVNQALRACIELKDYGRAENIHKNLSSSLVQNSFVRTNLIRLYMKSGKTNQSLAIFNTSTKKLTIMFNSILEGLLDNDQLDDALEIFKKTDINKNEYSYSILFKICAKKENKSALDYGRIFFERMPPKFKFNDIVLTSALQMFVKCGDIAMAEQLFSQMKKNRFAYSIMMNGFVANNLPERAIELFLKIDKPDKIIYTVLFNACAQMKTKDALDFAKKVVRGMPDEYRRSNDVLFSVLNMLIKCDDMNSAEPLFNQIDRDLISYGSMMKFYNVKNQPNMTLNLFERMKRENLKPNEIIFALLIDACSSIGDLSLCEKLFSQIPESFLSSPWIQTGLIDMWGKIGSPDRARSLFDTIEQPTAFSYSSMINGYGLNGMGREAVDLFRSVPEAMLDNCIYVCVLNACSHSGLVVEAHQIFGQIPISQRTEAIYTAMVDTFSRVFDFDQAEEFMDAFEKSNPPSIPMYMSILSGARNCKNISQSQKIYNRMLKNFTDHEQYLTSATVLVANTFAMTGDKSMASEIRMKLNRLDLKKVVGQSWTVVDGEVFTFRAHDQSHPRASEIYNELDRLKAELVAHGYEHDDSWITRPIKSHETSESILCGHSERIAIAFNLIQRPMPTRIQIAKNLRICGDCHNATKLIARIRQCTIVVRDANRIHHFYPNGQCSCQDHF